MINEKIKNGTHAVLSTIATKQLRSIGEAKDGLESSSVGKRTHKCILHVKIPEHYK